MDRALQLLARANAIGLDLGNPQIAGAIARAVRYADLKLSTGRADSDIAAELGMKVQQLYNLKVARVKLQDGREVPLVAVATQLVIAEFLTDESRRDARTMLFRSFHSYYPMAMDNMLRIAAGLPARDSGWIPAHDDQIAAFRAINEASATNAFLSQVFLGDTNNPNAETFLQLQERLQSDTTAIRLDE